MTFEEARAKALEEYGSDENVTEDASEDTTNVPSDMTEAETGEETPEEQEVQAVMENSENLSQQNNITEQAMQAAENATAQIQQLQAQMSELMAQNQQMAATIQQMSQINEDNAMAEVDDTPIFDFNAVMYEDEETQRNATKDFVNSLKEKIKKEVLAEYAPIFDDARQGMEAKEFAEALRSVQNIPELSNIGDIQPQIESILKNNKVLSGAQNVPMADKVLMAAMIANGVDKVQNPYHKPTTDELYNMYQNNPDLQKMIEKDRAQRAVSQKSEVPPLSAGGGIGNAALNTPKQPQTIDEATELAKKWFMKKTN